MAAGRGDAARPPVSPRPTGPWESQSNATGRSVEVSRRCAARPRKEVVESEERELEESSAVRHALEGRLAAFRRRDLDTIEALSCSEVTMIGTDPSEYTRRGGVDRGVAIGHAERAGRA